MNGVFKYKNVEIEYEVILKPSNKNLYLRIKDNKLYITSPQIFTYSSLHDLLVKKYDFIVESINKKSFYSLKESDFILIFGRKYSIDYVDNVSTYKIDHDLFVVYINNKFKNVDGIKKIKNKIYADCLEKEITKQYWIIVKKIPNFNMRVRFEIVDVKSYYGICFVKERLIKININLAKPNRKFLYLILCHEISHLFYPDHQKGFHNMHECLCKNHRRLDKELKDLHIVR